jgi:hypothetical protein
MESGEGRGARTATERPLEFRSRRCLQPGWLHVGIRKQRPHGAAVGPGGQATGHALERTHRHRWCGRVQSRRQETNLGQRRPHSTGMGGGRPLCGRPSSPATAMVSAGWAFSPDGKTLATASFDQTLRSGTRRQADHAVSPSEATRMGSGMSFSVPVADCWLRRVLITPCGCGTLDGQGIEVACRAQGVGLGRRLQPRRSNRRLGALIERCGSGTQQPANRPASQCEVIRMGSGRWPSARTPRRSPREATTGRCGSGMWRRAGRGGGPWKAIPIGSLEWPSVQMERHSRQRVSTAHCGSGTRQLVRRRGNPSRATPTTLRSCV